MNVLVSASLRLSGFLTLFLLSALRVSAISGEHALDAEISPPHWPAGLSSVVNREQRVFGYFEGARDVFLFKGSTHSFNDFLDACAKVEGVDGFTLELLGGIGRQNAPWAIGPGFKCDWMLLTYPGEWDAKTGKRQLELKVVVWADGGVALKYTKVPNTTHVTVVRGEGFNELTMLGSGL